MRIQLSILLLTICFSLATAQDDLIFPNPDSLAFAQFKGGDEKMFDLLAKHFKYPEEAKENNIQGKVICTVYVDTLGTIYRLEIFESPNNLLSEEVKRILMITSGMWEVQRDEEQNPIHSYLYVPVVFEIADNFVYKEPFDVDQLIDPNNLEQTKKNLNEAYRGDPTNSEILFKRGVIYFQLDDSKAACKDWKKAAKFGSEEAQQKLEQYCLD